MSDGVNIRALKDEDKRWKKTAGASYDEDAAKLVQFYEGRARGVVYSHLQALGVGDKANTRPLQVGTVRRVTDSLSVLYRLPATRMFSRAGEGDLDDTDPDVEAFAEVAEDMSYDEVWHRIDAQRNLLCQCVVVFVESDENRSVSPRVHPPCNVIRRPNPAAADSLERDEEFAILLRHAEHQQDELWEHWKRLDDDGKSWRVRRVNGSGTEHGEQPYDDTGGVIPDTFGGLPALIVHDQLPMGRAYLPIPEGRLDDCLNACAMANDLVFLVKQQAHNQPTVITQDPAGLPQEMGPNKLLVLTGQPGTVDIKNVAFDPKIHDSGIVLNRLLALVALRESLPPDTFSPDRKALTGAALRVSNLDLEARRQGQVRIAPRYERKAYEILARVHNTFAAKWDRPTLATDVRLHVTFGQSWLPMDLAEYQRLAYNDMSIGAMSVIDYLIATRNLTRSQARRELERVRADLEEFPPPQNPAAVVGGPNPAGAEGSATKTPGAFNPDRSGATEGASVTDAVRGASENIQ